MTSTHISFDQLTPIHPNRRIVLETGAKPIVTRLIDLFIPLGFGQRALVVAPPQAGKTTILREIAKAILTNHPTAHLFLCLVDERPEEVTDWKIETRSPQTKMFSSSFDQKSVRHGYIIEQALFEAKREVAQGRDVVILLDSLTRLARAHNNNPNLRSFSHQQRGYGGKTLSGGIDAQALESGRRVFGAARTLDEGGSLTIVASCLIETGSRLDDVVYEEFKSTGNLEIRLARELANRRIFPAIDLAVSSTRNEERLLSEAELLVMSDLRRRMADLPRYDAAEQAIKLFEKTPSNTQLINAVIKQQ